MGLLDHNRYSDICRESPPSPALPLCCCCWSIVWNVSVCPVRWRLEGAALGFLQQRLLSWPDQAVPPHPHSSSSQCPALQLCPTPRPRISAPLRAVRCFTSSPPVILRFTAARDELQTSHWAMCTSLWKPSDPVRTENALGLFPKQWNEAGNAASLLSRLTFSIWCQVKCFLWQPMTKTVFVCFSTLPPTVQAADLTCWSWWWPCLTQRPWLFTMCNCKPLCPR